MEWLDYYQEYLGIQLHFEQEKYDYTKYGPRKCDELAARKLYLILKAFEGKGEDREAFRKRLIASFRKKKRFITEMYSAEVDNDLKEYQSEIESWRYNLKTDLEYLVNEAESKSLSTKDIFVSANDFRLPLVASAFQRGKIKQHSFAMMGKIIPFMDKLSPLIFESRRMRKYIMIQNFCKRDIAEIAKPILGL